MTEFLNKELNRLAEARIAIDKLFEDAPTDDLKTQITRDYALTDLYSYYYLSMVNVHETLLKSSEEIADWAKDHTSLFDDAPMTIDGAIEDIKSTIEHLWKKLHEEQIRLDVLDSYADKDAAHKIYSNGLLLFNE